MDEGKLRSRSTMRIATKHPEQFTERLRVSIRPRRSFSRRPRRTFSFAKRHIRAGLGFKKHRPRLAGNDRVINAMRDCYTAGGAIHRQNSGLRQLARVVIEHNPETTTYDDHRFVLTGIKMAMRCNIRTGFNGVKQTMSDIGVTRVKVAILASPWAEFRFQTDRIKQRLINQQWLH